MVPIFRLEDTSLSSVFYKVNEHFDLENKPKTFVLVIFLWLRWCFYIIFTATLDYFKMYLLLKYITKNDLLGHVYPKGENARYCVKKSVTWGFFLNVGKKPAQNDRRQCTS